MARRFSVNIAEQEVREEERGGAGWERTGGEVKFKMVPFRYYEKEEITGLSSGLRDFRRSGLRIARLFLKFIKESLGSSAKHTF